MPSSRKKSPKSKVPSRPNYVYIYCTYSIEGGSLPNDRTLYCTLNKKLLLASNMCKSGALMLLVSAYTGNLDLIPPRSSGRVPPSMCTVWYMDIWIMDFAQSPEPRDHTEFLLFLLRVL